MKCIICYNYICKKIKNINIPVLITDTVGFIENLPTWLINAFHSTLEEIELADLVLLIVDASDNLEIFYNKKRREKYEKNYYLYYLFVSCYLKL